MVVAATLSHCSVTLQTTPALALTLTSCFAPLSRTTNSCTARMRTVVDHRTVQRYNLSMTTTTTSVMARSPRVTSDVPQWKRCSAPSSSAPSLTTRPASQLRLRQHCSAAVARPQTPTAAENRSHIAVDSAQ